MCSAGQDAANFLLCAAHFVIECAPCSLSLQDCRVFHDANFVRMHPKRCCQQVRAVISLLLFCVICCARRCCQQLRSRHTALGMVLAAPLHFYIVIAGHCGNILSPSPASNMLCCAAPLPPQITRLLWFLVQGETFSGPDAEAVFFGGA